MALFRERRYRKEEDLDHVVEARWWLMKPIWDRQVFPQRLHVTICPMFISEGSRFFSPSPFVFPVGPSFDFKWSGSLVDCMSPVRSIGCLSTGGNRCCMCRGTFSKCLCIFSEVSLCRNGQWIILHTVWLLVGHGLPSWRHVLPSEAVFWGAWPLCW